MSEENDIRIPDVEIIIQAAGSDVATICFYFPGDVHSQAEVVTAVSEPGALPHLVALLHQAIASLNGEDWYTVDRLDTRDVPNKQNNPF